jgi:transmembrane sensor
MKKMKDIEKFSDKDWQYLASVLSGEKSEDNRDPDLSLSEDKYKTENYWKELENMSTNNKINVDKAWINLHSRIESEIGIKENFNTVNTFSIYSILKVAAIVIISIGLGWTALYLNNSGVLSRNITASADTQKNIEVVLSDGSKVILNHETRLVYPKNFREENRKVKLTGEALFDITPDATRPFIIDAGKAKIKVVGTIFNVITSNDLNAVEVFVKSGKVLLIDSLGKQNLTLEPGYLGIMDTQTSEKHINNDPNYLAWNTNKLTYDGQKLEVVFNDLKRVYNIEIVANNAEILNSTIRTTFENETEDSIIKLICLTFNLNSEKEGNIYHLSNK